jgi:hypothetical protein
MNSIAGECRARSEMSRFVSAHTHGPRAVTYGPDNPNRFSSDFLAQLLKWAGPFCHFHIGTSPQAQI